MMEKKIFKDKFKKIFYYFLISFAGLFSLRLLYGYLVYSDDIVGESSVQSFNQQGSFELARKNYASEKKFYQSGNQSLSLPAGVAKFDQKYEKIGSLSASTNEFDKEEKNVRELIKNFKALIQYEESSGLEGKRHLNLGIGVNPDKFDEIISEIK